MGKGSERRPYDVNAYAAAPYWKELERRKAAVKSKKRSKRKEKTT